MEELYGFVGVACCQRVTELGILNQSRIWLCPTSVLTFLRINFTLQDRYLRARELNNILVTFTCVHTHQASQRWLCRGPTHVTHPWTTRQIPSRSRLRNTWYCIFSWQRFCEQHRRQSRDIGKRDRLPSYAPFDALCVPGRIATRSAIRVIHPVPAQYLSLNPSHHQGSPSQGRICLPSRLPYCGTNRE